MRLSFKTNARSLVCSLYCLTPDKQDVAKSTRTEIRDHYKQKVVELLHDHKFLYEEVSQRQQWKLAAKAHETTLL